MRILNCINRVEPDVGNELWNKLWEKVEIGGLMLELNVVNMNAQGLSLPSLLNSLDESHKDS